MKKRFLALFLCLAMILTLIPATVTAEEADPAVSESAAAETVVSADPEEIREDASGEPTEEASAENSEAIGESASSDDPIAGEGSAVAGESSVSTSLSGRELFDALMACESYEAMTVLLTSNLADDEAARAFEGSLSEEQMTALAEKVMTFIPEEAGAEADPDRAQPQTVVFTQAGPFMPAVQVTATPKKKLFAAPKQAPSGEPSNAPGPSKAPGDPDDNGVETSKSVVATGDDSYTITIEVWTTGEVTVADYTTPVDFVLVLDQSCDMNLTFDGEGVATSSNSRQASMKAAVNSFISSVNDKFDAEQSDHRIAIVTYAAGASVLRGWTFADAAGKTALQNAINGLGTPEGDARTDLGLQNADTLMDAGYSYSGSNLTRQKVVILYTGGVPGTAVETGGGWWTDGYYVISFDQAYADNAVAAALSLKEEGVTVYSVGVFAGADPSQLHGAAAEYSPLLYGYEDIPCNGGTTAPGFIWGASGWSTLFGALSSTDVAAGNRFLNYVSSNFPDAAGTGIVKGRYDARTVLGDTFREETGSILRPLTHDYGDTRRGNIDGYKIVRNYTRASDAYYLTAADASGLSTIFTTISSHISHPTIELNDELLVIDVVSPYFIIDGEAEGNPQARVYTADYNGALGTFETPVLRNDITCDISSNTAELTGYSFDENFVTEQDKGGGDYGRKLILEIDISRDPDFAGGNDVPTNGEGSGVFIPDGNGGYTVLEEFEVPTANITFADVNIESADVYLYETALTDDLVDSIISEVVHYAPSNFDYANLVEDFDWEIIDGICYVTSSVTILPLTDGSSSLGAGTPANPVSKTVDTNFHVYMMQPTVTFKDSVINAGSAVPTDFTANLDSVVWSCTTVSGTTVTGDDVTMFNEEPALTYSYVPSRTGTVSSLSDVGVSVTVVNQAEEPDLDYSSRVAHKDCSDRTDSLGSYDFLLHVRPYTLSYSWDGNVPSGQQLPTDTQGYADLAAAHAAIDSSYPAGYTVTGTDLIRIFSGWTAAEPDSDNVIRLTGNWSLAYKVSFLSETGVSSYALNGATAPQYFAAGEEVTANVSILEGYHLLYWEGSGYEPTAAQAQQTQFTFSMPDAPVLLHAKLAANQSTLRIDPNGGIWNGTTEVRSLTGAYNTTCSIPVPTRENYDFIGWTLASSVTGDPVNGSMSSLTGAANYSYGKTAAVTDVLTAQWQRKESSLTLSKTGWNAVDSGQSFLFHVTSVGSDPDVSPVDVYVTIQGNGSVTISGLSVGAEYLIEEVSSWSWRYTPAGSVSKTLDADASQNVLTVTNTRSGSKWLSSCDCKVNKAE